MIGLWCSGEGTWEGEVCQTAKYSTSELDQQFRSCDFPKLAVLNFTTLKLILEWGGGTGRDRGESVKLSIHFHTTGDWCYFTTTLVCFCCVYISKFARKDGNVTLTTIKRYTICFILSSFITSSFLSFNCIMMSCKMLVLPVCVRIYAGMLNCSINNI